MKKTFRILGFIALFIGIMLLHSSVSAAGTNGIVLSIEDDVKAVRTDKGNTTTLQLQEGEYYQETSTLSASFQKAIAGDKEKNISAGVYCYIPVPKDFDTKYKYAKVYDANKGKDNLYWGVFADENFKQIPTGREDGTETYEGVKYVEKILPISALTINGQVPGDKGVSRLYGTQEKIGIIYYDQNGKAAKTEEYSINILPKFSTRQLKIKMYYEKNANSYAILYNGQSSSTQTSEMSTGMVKGDVRYLKTSNTQEHFNIWDKDITNKTTFKVDNENVISVDKDGKITAKNPGVATVTITVEGISKKLKVDVYAETYFEKEITDEQINDLIADAKAHPNNTAIGFATNKNTVLPAKLLKAAKELKKDLWLNVYNDELKYGYTWSMKYTDISDTSKDVDLTISKVDCFIDSLKDRKDALFLDFKHNGKLPAKATVNLYLYTEEDTKEQDVHLYYYNEGTKKLEYVSAVKRNKYGEIEMTLDHCSRYVITETKLSDAEISKATDKKANSETKNNNRKLDGEPKAGDTTEMLVVAGYMLAIISAGAIFYTIKK